MYNDAPDTITLRDIYNLISAKEQMFWCIFEDMENKKIYSYAGEDKKKWKFVLLNHENWYVEYYESLNDFNMLGLPIYYGHVLWLWEIKVKEAMYKKQSQSVVDYILMLSGELIKLWIYKDMPIDMSCENEEQFGRLLSVILQLNDIKFEDKESEINDIVEELKNEVSDLTKSDQENAENT